ncbi:MAG: hypothetical protein V4481_05370 [Patescibacteria group bacterium]
MKLFSQKTHSARPHNKREVTERVRNLGHDPHIDWVLILLFATAVAVVLVVIGVYSYLNAEIELSKTPTVVPIISKTLNPDMLKHVLGQYETYSQERAELIKAYKGPADPSL